ncbi:hypothetical protein KXV46_008975, partial [Aspergillus fumigatus]
MYLATLTCSFLFARLALTQTGVIDPISEDCGPSVVCVNHYANVLPYHFYRNISTSQAATTIGDTVVANGTSLPNIKSADFVVYDKERGLKILGTQPTYKYMFAVSDAVHEAPVYVAAQNKLYLSQLAPPAGYLPQLVVDLNQDPPTLSEFLSDPPVYAPNGGTFYNGRVIWGASGGNRSIEYSWFNKLTDTPPQLPSATYRYNPKSGAVFVVDDSLSQPNGIAFNPDYSIVYISDTGAVSGPVDPKFGHPGTPFNATGPRTIYAFDVSKDGTTASNKRPVYLSAGYVPDGLKVAANGYIVTGNGRGVDVLDPHGQLLLTIQTNYTVQNFAWTGPKLKTLWLMGSGGISKVEWDLAGQEL